MSVGEVAALIGSCAASGGVIVAAVTLIRTWLNLREQLRPVVVAELQKHPYGKWIQEIVVRNYGQTPARKVRVTFSPPIADPDPKSTDATSVTAALVRRFAKEVSVLPPRGELRQIYYVGDEEAGTNKVINSEPTPDVITVTISYHGQGRKKPYTDEFVLDVHLIGLSTSVGSKDNPSAQRRVIADGVAKLAQITRWP